MVLEVSRLHEWSNNDQKQERLCQKGFLFAFGGFNMAKTRRYLHGFVRLPGTKPRKYQWFQAV